MEAIYDAGGELVFAGSLLDTQAPKQFRACIPRRVLFATRYPVGEIPEHQ
jgi:hypothetical protein